MKKIKKFKRCLEAVDWIASNVENEGQFEVLREQLNNNFIYFGEHFLELIKAEDLLEVVTLNRKDQI